MIEFPAATAVHRRLPKEAFYKHLPLTKILKEKFVSDVDRIVVENSFTKENLNLASDADIKEIMLLSISLKNQEFDGKVIEAIARQNPHKLVFLLSFESQQQLAVYYNKLYRTLWMDHDEIALKLNLPLEDDRVFAALLDKEIRCFSEEVYEKLLNPLYFRKEATAETLIL